MITPVTPIILENLSSEERKKYFDIGSNVIKEGKIAVCYMAGGQGTRLGHDGPKGTFIVNFKKTTPKSIFEIQIEKFIKTYNKYGTYIYLFIMTSRENDEATNKFLKDNNYFGYPSDKIITFIQGEFPLTNREKVEILDEQGNKVMAANGNGGIFKALEDMKILSLMQEKGIDYLVTCNIDNILSNPLDEIAAGIIKENGYELLIKTVKKEDPKEKVGVVLKDAESTKVIEYIDLPQELANKTDENGELLLKDAHFGVNLLSIELLKRIAKEPLKIHEAYKKSEKYGEYIKYEMFIFDGFDKSKNTGVLRVKREDEFAPIKNSEGIDSPETAILLFENKI